MQSNFVDGNIFLFLKLGDEKSNLFRHVLCVFRIVTARCLLLEIGGSQTKRGEMCLLLNCVY